MSTAVDANLPDDVQALKALARCQARELRQREDVLASREARIAWLEEQLNLLRAQRYGASAETVSEAQLRLFNEAEAEVLDEEPEYTDIEPHRRRRPKRKALPSELPRIDVEHPLPEQQRVCPRHGVALERFGEDTSEQLDIVPAKIRVLRHIRGKYRCPCCTGHIVTAPMTPQPIPKSLASPGLLAHIAVAKFVDGLPLYRQHRQLERIGVDLSRTTIAQWMIRTGQLVQPLINLLRETMLSESYLLMDETTVQVLKEPGKAPESKSYLWAQMSVGANPIILFDYDPTRSSAVPVRLLEGFEGALHTDGYRGYDGVVRGEGLVRLYCFAHARRKFVDVLKTLGLNPKKLPDKPPAKARQALKAIGLIKGLYAIERRIKDKAPDERYRVRQEQAIPLLDKLRQWLERTRPRILPSSALGQALRYLDQHWSGLVRYCADGRYGIDTNPVENAIRPFCLGRRAWLFSDSVAGAKSSANLYSLIETARANGLEPYAYLRRVFTELPKAATIEDIEALLPARIDPTHLDPPASSTSI